MSIIISACTTGLASATISYDFDTDPSKRRNNPEFYGYCPDGGGGRLLVFLLLFLNSTSHILGRTLSAALLATVSANYLWTYIGADMGLYLLFKVARCDFYYWIPLRGVLAIIVSFLCRIFVKVIVDYTGCVHFRHPYDLGGFYWTFNLVLSQLSVLGATLLYTAKAKDAETAGGNSRNEKNMTEGIHNISMSANNIFDGDETALSSTVDPSQLWVIVGCICALWFWSFTAFIFSINRKYIKTFFTKLTGQQVTLAQWANGDEDAVKADAAFCAHESHTASIRDDVQEWVHANWYRWEVEKPAWWTDAMKASIPNDMLPAPALKEEEKKGGGERRRSSLGDIMAVAGGSAEVVPASK